MFSHPEDLYRAQQLKHAETIRNYTLERQAGAVARPPHQFREIALRIGGFVLPRRWWKHIGALFSRRPRSAGSVTTTVTTTLPDGAPPTASPDSSARALSHPTPESARR